MDQKKSAPQSQSEQLHNGDQNPPRTRPCVISELRVSISGRFENGATFSTEGTVSDVGKWDARDFLYNLRYCIPDIEMEE